MYTANMLYTYVRALYREYCVYPQSHYMYTYKIHSFLNVKYVLLHL